MLFTPRKIGWGLTGFSYLLAVLHWKNIDNDNMISDAMLFGIIAITLMNVVLAIKFKHYDLFAAATFTLTSLLVVFWWHGPFFSAR
ncbi:MAG: hypothetical protein Q4A92_11015 [Corynebacterium sp.]|nr:hypothetical protein [Corynebacterium sp.]